MKTVCVDLDGVLAHYDGWKGLDHIGLPRDGAAGFLDRLAKVARVVIFTTRCKADGPELGRPAGETAETLKARVEGWLVEHGLTFHEVYVGQGKPIACAYVDDRAVQVPANPNPPDFDAALVAVQRLL